MVSYKLVYCVDMEKIGTIPSQGVRNLMRGGSVINGHEENIQPSSLDLTIGKKISRLPCIFLPETTEKIADIANKIGAEPFSFEYPLEVNTPYLIKLREELHLPPDVYAYANPKSSSGRNDLHVTMLADNMARFDSAGTKGYKGQLWVIVEPKSYRVKLSPGETLMQLRFFYSDTRLSHSELENVFEDEEILYVGDKLMGHEDIKTSDRDGGLILTIDLEQDLVGWRCEGSGKYVDFSERGLYQPNDFFTPLRRPPEEGLLLRKGDFYIFYTKEKIRVPPDFAVEVVAVDTRSGEFRSHYAGFVDPGWGYSEDNSVKGAPLVLEMRPYGDNITIRKGQPICKVTYERMAETPDIIYGKDLGSHYHNQSGPRLSKHFKM